MGVYSDDACLVGLCEIRKWTFLERELMGRREKGGRTCATSAKMQSTMPTNIRYLCGFNVSGDVQANHVLPAGKTYLSGCRASSIMGIMFVRFVARLMRSRPLRWENSTAKTMPLGPTMSETCETEVPDAAPR